MPNQARDRAFIHRMGKAANRGDSLAILNTAEAYRRTFDPDRMFKWFRKAAKHHDGEALLETGLCFQFGVGTRKNIRAAEHAYRAAIASAWISESSREEAMFYLATLLLGVGRSFEVRRLLMRANVERDYPQAAALLVVLGSARWRTMCLCRRERLQRIGAGYCPVHNRAPHGRRSSVSARSGDERLANNGLQRTAGAHVRGSCSSTSARRR
jgi:hypothetical protein